MALPFLPGNSFDKNLGKTRFHKSHFFDYNDDVPVEKTSTDEQSTSKSTSVYPEGVGTGQPAWIAFDRQVLRFFGYFQEGVEEKREEQFRIRNCVILFYLEDDSIQVNEKYTENSGMPQGTLIRRHKIPLPPPNDDQFYTIQHLNVDQKIQFYSKTFQITGCDKFTENFLRKLGVKLAQPQDTPSDPYSQYRDKISTAMQPLRPYERLDTLKQFLDYDRKVLRFYCLWDDTESMFGDHHELVLHYYLADDTIEILEKVPPNSGRDGIPVFLIRAKLPKNPPNVHQPGVQTKRTVLNVFGPTGNGSRYILDALKTGEVTIEYYRDNDLVIGNYINVWGRKILLCDCDEFTKAFYRSKYNVEEFQSIKFPEESPREIKDELPPYNGFGSEEDSLSSHYNLIPKPPRKDHVKYMEKDRCGLNSNILRFIAHLKTKKGINSDRKFIVSYYLCDDTIAVFEPPVRNSGIIGGMFLQRGKIVKPKCNHNDSMLYYQTEDLYIGAELVFNNFHFILVDADEYALKYMEEELHQFPHANIELILAKLKGPATIHVDQIKTAFNNADTNNTGLLPNDQFKGLVKTLAQGLLNEHEVLTLSRKYKDKTQIPLSSIVNIVRDDLKRQKFTQFSKVQEAFQSSDIDESGFVDKDRLLHICHLIHLPLADQLILALMENCDKDSNKRILYSQFVQLLDWNNHLKVKCHTESDIVQLINYAALIKDLTTNEN